MSTKPNLLFRGSSETLYVAVAPMSLSKYIRWAFESRSSLFSHVRVG